MAGNFGKVNVSIAASTGGLTRGLSDAQRQMRGFQGSIKRIDFAASFVAAERAISLLTGAARRAFSAVSAVVTSASNLTEEQTKSAVVFGSAANSVAEFAKSAKAIGISESAALKAVGTYGNLFRSMGFGEQQAASFSVAMTRIAADLASFNNVTTDDALLAVRSALVGEIEPIRRLGVLLNEQTLKAEAMAMGFGKISGVLPPVIRLQAAYSSILKQTTLAQGDFARTSGNFANQQRILEANFENISASLGKAFLPLLTKLSQVIIDSMPSIEAFVSEWTNFLVGGANQFDGAAVSVDNFTASIRALSAELRTLRGFGDLLASLAGSVGAGGFMIAEDVTWLVGLRDVSEQFGREAKVWAAATESLFAAAKERIDNPNAGFDAAMRGRKPAGGVADATVDDRARQLVLPSVSGLFDMVTQYGQTALTLTREGALGFTRAAIAGLEMQASVSTQSLQALVVGTSEAQAYINRLGAGYDPRRVENDASRTANATEQSAATLNSIERLFNNIGLGLATIGA